MIKSYIARFALSILLLTAFTSAQATLMDLSGSPTSGNADYSNNGMTVQFFASSEWIGGTERNYLWGEGDSIAAAEFTLDNGNLFTFMGFNYEHGHSGEHSLWEAVLGGVVQASVHLPSVNNGGFFVDMTNDFLGVQMDTMRVSLGDGHDISVSSVTFTEVPEPSTLAIFALGIMGIASRRFKEQ